MDPDGRLPDDDRERRKPPPAPAPRRKSKSKRADRGSRTRESGTKVGARRRAGPPKPESGRRRPRKDIDWGAVRRPALWSVGVLLVLGGLLAAVLASGTRVIHVSAADAAAAQVSLARAVKLLRAGDIDGARAVRSTVDARTRQAPAMVMLEGYALAVEGADEAATEARLLRYTWNRRRALENQLILASFRELNENIDGALAALDHAKRLSKEDRNVWVLKPTLMVGAGRPLDALRELDALEQATNEDAWSQELRGHALMQTHSPRKALEAYEKALTYSPHARASQLGVIDACIELRRYSEALKKAEAGLKKNVDDPELQGRAGIAYERLGRLEDAEAAYRMAVKLAPRDLHGLNNLAYLLVARLNKPREALVFAIKAIRLDPNSQEILDTLGWTYYRLGENEKALLCLERAARYVPGHPEVTAHIEAVKAAMGE